ncbi:MAG: NnrS family protein [Acetobacteraceae bacterium]|nr:NnrS family protein [Acetobacteraceae bacterium]
MQHQPPPPALAVFAHGFRPYFLIAGIWAVVPIAVWVSALHGAALPDGLFSPQQWHAHEMIAGFIGAAMCGFLLTAVPNWTGRRGYGGPPLVLVAGLFVAARIALWPGVALPPALAATIALLPIPAVLLMVLPALIRSRTPRLFGPPILILLFWFSDVLMLADAAGWQTGTFTTGRTLAINMALALVGLIGGRIVPSFTVNALRRAGRKASLNPIPRIDEAAMVALFAVAAVDVILPDSTVSGLVAAIAAVLVLLRLSGWHGLSTLGQPILWVLHLGYLMIAVALATKAAFLLAGWALGMYWMHLQAMGAIGLMILAVMSRAILGHTGRALVAPWPAAAGYALVPVAALLRAFGGFAMPYQAAIGLAGATWIAAYALFLFAFAPMLLRRRPDGKPG